MAKKINNYNIFIIIAITFLVNIFNNLTTINIKKNLNKYNKTLKQNEKSIWIDIENKASKAVVRLKVEKQKIELCNIHANYPLFTEYGSGFFIDSNGLILTNFHVIENAKSIGVNIPDLGKKIIYAKIISICPKLDLALIKITKKSKEIINKSIGDIPYLKLGDSNKIERAEKVLTLGYPLASFNIKSTLGEFAGRDFNHDMPYMHITAPINPGNSGGPLINKKGEVIGINTAIMPNSQNIAYSIAINNVKPLLNIMLNKKIVNQPSLGIKYNPLTKELANILKHNEANGIYIYHVIKNSPAFKAGIKEGDILYKIDNYDIDEFGFISTKWNNSHKIKLKEYISIQDINHKINLKIKRDGKNLNLPITIDIIKEEKIRTIYPFIEPLEADYEMIGGITIMQLRKNHLKELPSKAQHLSRIIKDNNDQDILIISNILPRSIFYNTDCIDAGDIIDTINNYKIKNLEELRHLISNLDFKKNEYLHIKTTDNKYIVVSIKDIIKKEKKLSQLFNFKITPATRKLINKFKDIK